MIRKQREGVSDGLSLPCSVCDSHTQIDYHATDEAWENITRRHGHGDRLGVICLECFISLLLQHEMEPSACIERVDVIGKADTRVFLPSPRLRTEERDGKREAFADGCHWAMVIMSDRADGHLHDIETEAERRWP